MVVAHIDLQAKTLYFCILFKRYLVVFPMLIMLCRLMSIVLYKTKSELFKMSHDINVLFFICC